ncbi:C-terminal binding protein [Candidatus Poribacteria bacterium]|nr:MAG: C-terminal binding protein [Candidatus Poribacteria bacterium]
MRGKFKVAATDVGRFPPQVESEILEKVGAEIVPVRAENEDELIEGLRDADAILNVATKITRRVIESLEKCRVIVRYGIGVDTVDIKAATEKGICVANVPDFCWEEVSDTAMSLILAVTRKVVYLNNLVKQGIWDRSRARPIHRFQKMTLGLLSFGNIPRTLVKKARPFGFKRIISYDPYVPREVFEMYGVEPVDLDTLLRESDVLSIHTPLTEETYHMIGEAELRKMKPTAYLINTGRGAVIDERALYRALKEGWIAGAGLDVLEKEPPDPDNPLLKLDNVVITPHYASYTEEAYHELRVKVAENAAAALQGKLPKYVVNPEVIPKLKWLREKPSNTR